MSSFRLDVVSLVPEVFDSLRGLGVIGRAFNAGIAELHTHNPRDYAADRYRKVDDEPYGGGAGMVLKPEPVFAAFEAIPVQPRRRVLLSVAPVGICEAGVVYTSLSRRARSARASASVRSPSSSTSMPITSAPFDANAIAAPK